MGEIFHSFKCYLNHRVCSLQDVFDLPFHMARDQIEESLRNKMASIKVVCFPFTHVPLVNLAKYELLMGFISYVTNLKERMVQLQDAQKEAEVTSEVTERELELEAQLVEARSIIQEQVSFFYSYASEIRY